MEPTGTAGFVFGILNWLVVLLLRKFTPGFWDALDKRMLRFVLIATTAALIACVNGILGGLPVLASLKLAAQAFFVSVTARELTKRDEVKLGGYMPSLSRSLSIETKAPEPNR